MSLLGGFVVPLDGTAVVLCGAAAVGVHPAEAELRGGVALLGFLLGEGEGLQVVCGFGVGFFLFGQRQFHAVLHVFRVVLCGLIVAALFVIRQRNLRFFSVR